MSFPSLLISCYDGTTPGLFSHHYGPNRLGSSLAPHMLCVLNEMAQTDQGKEGLRRTAQPGYRFSPNKSPEDECCAPVAQLLSEGKKGDELSVSSASSTPHAPVSTGLSPTSTAIISHCLRALVHQLAASQPLRCGWVSEGPRACAQSLIAHSHIA